jgi:uncharacterized spore protein YtfJ
MCPLPETDGGAESAPSGTEEPTHEEEDMPDIDEMWKGVREAMTVSRVFGEPIDRSEVTIVPVASVRGVGVGGGDERTNGGGGFAIKARPVGAFVIRNDSVAWRPAVDLGRLVSALALVASAWLLFRRNRHRLSRSGR